MHVDVLQPWVTVQGTATAVTSVTQEYENWLDVSDCADITAWIDVRSVTPVSGGSISLSLESSPTESEELFAPIAAVVTLVASANPILLSSVSGAASVSPLARFLRWVVTSSPSSASGTWSVTFRIRLARFRAPAFSPMRVPGCVLWLRADLGVTTAAGSTIVMDWADQSGNGSNMTAVEVGGSYPTLGSVGNVPNINFTTGPYLTTSTGVAISQPDSVLVVAASAGTPTGYGAYFCNQATADQSFAQTDNQAAEISLNAGTNVNQTMGVNLTSPGIIQVDFNGSSSQVFQNGIQQNSGGINPGANGGTFTSIGANFNGLSPFAGWIAEVLVFEPQLTSTWRTLVTRYLGGRYGIAVP